VSEPADEIEAQPLMNRRQNSSQLQLQLQQAEKA
jgi:hypothetical protein